MFATVSGCDEGYPEDQKYALRTDALVTVQATVAPSGLGSLGPEGWHALELQFTNPEMGKGKMVNPADVPVDIRVNLEKLLEEHFGTPANPIVKDVERIENDEGPDEGHTGQVLKLDDKTLRQGSRLYRQQCVLCHGITGNGRGPTASWLVPRPRDYRQGEFKFISSARQPGYTRKASRADLLRVLQQGIDGSSMPAFGLLPQTELEDVASYVIHLSIRGEVEFRMMAEAIGQQARDTKEFKVNSDDGETYDFESYFRKRFNEVVQSWIVSQKRLQPGLSYEQYLRARSMEQEIPEDLRSRDAIKRGYSLFQTQAGCAACHFDYGRQRNYKWDVWGNVTRPADLTTGIYRGGRRPIDFYYRIRGGISPSGMPAQDIVKERKGHLSDAGLTDHEIWDVVEFVRALPNPGMLPTDIRAKIYPAIE
jgi:mono/diheme cytochrome c family protein